MRPHQRSLHPFKIADRRSTYTRSAERQEASANRGVSDRGRTKTQTDKHTHIQSGLNAYLLANLKDRFLKKKTNKKRQNKKRNKKKTQSNKQTKNKKPTRRYVDKQVGVGFSGSRASRVLEEPLSETRVLDFRSVGSCSLTCVWRLGW